MAELTNTKQFRFQPQIKDVVDEILPVLSPHDRDFLLNEIEPLLARRDWQVEDAVTRALQCCGATAGGDPSSSILADSPLGYWKLQDAIGPSTFVSVGSVSPGTMTANGYPTFQETVAGVLSTRFNPATGDQGSLSSTSQWSPHQGGSGVMTAEAWVYPRAFTGGMMIVSKGVSGAFEYSMSIDASGVPSAGVAQPTGATVMGVTAAASLPLNTWTHIAFTYNRATPLISLYVGGVLSASSGTASGTSSATSTSTAIGGGWSGATRFNGNLAHVVIYGTALSAARIAAHAAFVP